MLEHVDSAVCLLRESEALRGTVGKKNKQNFISCLLLNPENMQACFSLTGLH